nr:DUF1642 domain-containing protein [Streptococcus constellatus]
MNKIKQVKAIGNIIGFNIDASGNETYNVQFPDMTIAELESYQFEEADAYRANEKPFYLRNVLARLRELPEHDRKVWLKGIMDEFELDFSHAKWREGYEQGKFEGMLEREKVKIPQMVAEWIESCKKKRWTLYLSLDQAGNNEEKVCEWIFGKGMYDYNNQEIFAQAWIFGYEVEQEKRYEVSIKASGQYLARTKLKEIKFMYNGACSRFTRKELEDAGFGWVFDCEGVEVQEVE